MSWDVSLVINTGVEDVEVKAVGNYTYNVSPMYMDAMGKSISDFHGLTAEESIVILKEGIDKMQNNPEHYQKLNPENGWGSYDGALKFLHKIYVACVEHPKCKIEVS